MKTRLLIVIFFLSSLILPAQHQTDKWYFGLNAGVDFSTGFPQALNDGVLNSIEGCSSVSDSLGNLLFYTDGKTVWNNQHVAMPNGTGLLAGITVQAALIVPLPGSSTQYFIFTLDEVNGPNGLQYSIVDMTLDSGKGDVTIMNGFIQDGLTEKLTATINNTGDGYWITVHEFGGNAFYNYSVSSTGLDSTFVVSITGIEHSATLAQNSYGQMKYSPCGDKLALAAGYLDTVQVFDFDNSTGVISNPITIPMPDHVFGLEFSPDGRKIYISTYASATLYQYDLTSGIQDTIIATATALSITTDTYGLQLASDGKIYVAKNQSSWLGVISDPNVAGPSCNYIDSGFNLDPLSLGHNAGLCLPGFVQSYFYDVNECSAPAGTSEIDSPEIIVFPNPSASLFNVPIKVDSEISIYDETGRQMEMLISNASEIVVGEKLSKGIYFIRIKSDEGIRVGKLIKL